MRGISMLVEANRSRVFFCVLLATSAAVGAFTACSDDAASPTTPGNDSGTTTPTPTPTPPGTDGAATDFTLTIQEEQLAKSQSPLPSLPPSPGNKYADNAMAAALGQQFFFEKAIAGPISQVPNDLGAATDT